MDRRSFGKIMALFGVAPLWKGEKEMARVGDIFANWARGDRLSHAEIEQVRRSMNEMYAQSRQASNILDDKGGLDPNVFSHKSGDFSVLPHECGAMFATTDQTIGTGAATTLVYDADNAATWSNGLKIEPSTGRIYVTGIPKETVVLIVGWVTWTANDTGYRRLKWKANDGSSRIVDEQGPVAGTETWQQVIHLRKVPSTHTYYYLEVEQTSGGDLDTLHAGFAMARIR